MNKIEQSTLSKISNLIFLTLTTFIISFIWINYYINNLQLSLVASIIIALFFFVCYLVFKHYQQKIYYRNNNKKNNICSLRNFLLYSSYNEIENFISNIYNLTNLSKTNKTNHLVDIANKCDIYLLFDRETILEDDYIYIYKTQQFNLIKVFCINNTSKYEALENTKIEIETINDIYKKILDMSVTIPNSIQIKKTPIFKAKDVFCIALNKAKSKNYFIWGLLLVFLSIFSPYYIYYNITGSVLLLLALYSRFNKKFN